MKWLDSFTAQSSHILAQRTSRRSLLTRLGTLAVGTPNISVARAQTNYMLNWILTTMSSEQLSQDFLFYTEAEVRQTRQRILVDVAEVRAGLVSTMSQYLRYGLVLQALTGYGTSNIMHPFPPPHCDKTIIGSFR